MKNINKDAKIYIAGHTGMVGSAIKRCLEKNGYDNILFRSKDQLDLIRQEKVEKFFKDENPEIVIIAAARVGGILANNTYRAQFIYDNLMIESNLIHSSFLNKVEKLIFLGSSCIYPRECPQPIKEEYLLSSKLEKTNEGYAIAKIAGLKMCEHYYKQYGMESVCLMPCNLYGPNDNYDLNSSHVFPALIRKFSDAVKNNNKEVILWGTGIALREFMHVSDVARAVLFFIDKKTTYDLINISSGHEVSIKELAEIIAKKTNFKGVIVWDNSKPDGTLRKLLDVTKMKEYGFMPEISLNDGIDEILKIYNSI